MATKKKTSPEADSAEQVAAGTVTVGTVAVGTVAADDAAAAEATAKPKRKAATRKAPAKAASEDEAAAAPVAKKPAAKKAATKKAAAKTAEAETADVDDSVEEATSAVQKKAAPKTKAAAKPKAASKTAAKAKVEASAEDAAPAEVAELAEVGATVAATVEADEELVEATELEPRAKKKKKKAAAVADADVAADVAGDVDKPAVAAPAPKPPLPMRSEPELAAPPAFPETEYAVVEKLLVGFLSHEIRKVGLTRAVLGLSGGVDSAVSAALAARALGPANVLGVMMPYQSSSPESLADATAVAAALGIQTVTVEISQQVDSYFGAFPDASRLRRGNKMARERMTILYDHSAADPSLVIGTSNKTELLLGYGTLYGDMASALNPIGDLYKTQVWGLARHLGLPTSVIEKAPTADLWSGQTDEDELGFSYQAVDQLLFRMIDERCSHAEMVSMGFDEAFVERISKMVRSSQFKRRLPIIAKLSTRSIDTDFRYSRDWGL